MPGAEKISALQSVVDGAKNENEKRRLEANLEQLKKELEILSSRREIEDRQRMLAEDLTASPLDMLREKLRAVDRTAEEGEARRYFDAVLDAVRDGLMAEGLLGPDAVTLRVWDNLNLTREELRQGRLLREVYARYGVL